MQEFMGKVVYIAGGSSGIGLAAARLFAAGGARLVLFARREKILAQAASSVKGTGPVAYFPVDVTDPEAVKAAFADAAGSLGPPDILVNCAGRAVPRRFEEISVGQLEETFRINMFGTWNTCSEAIPMMRRRGSGYIVNTSSVGGFVGVFGYTDYSASKFAVIGFSQVLRNELKPEGIRVSVLCPPDTDTPAFHQENKTKPPETKAISGTASLLTPDQVARALIKGMRRRRFMIIPGTMAGLTYTINRLAPGIVRRMIDSDVRRVRRSGM